MIGAGQVVVVQRLPEVGPEAVHEDTGTLVVTNGGQVVAVKLLPEAAATGVQLAIGVGPVTTGAGQVVAVQALPELAIAGVQDSTGTLVVLLGVQAVVVQALSAVAASGTQFCTPTGPVTTGAGQVVVVQALPDVGPLGVQLSTGALVVLFVPQVVAVSCCRRQRPLAYQEATRSDRSSLAPDRSWSSSCSRRSPAEGVPQTPPARWWCCGRGRSWLSRRCPAVPLAAEQVDVGTLVVTSGLQVTVVQLLPEVGARRGAGGDRDIGGGDRGAGRRRPAVAGTRGRWGATGHRRRAGRRQRSRSSAPRHCRRWERPAYSSRPPSGPS